MIRHPLVVVIVVLAFLVKKSYKVQVVEEIWGKRSGAK